MNSKVSIHANGFQSTPSARRATHNGRADVLTKYISIHALREESDGPRAWRFRPHCQFQSTPSARRATSRWQLPCTRQIISIHALREESDFFGAIMRLRKGDFNPRPPRGERRCSPHTRG